MTQHETPRSDIHRAIISERSVAKQSGIAISSSMQTVASFGCTQ